MALVHFRKRRRFETVEQVVGLYAQALPAADLHVWLPGFFLIECVPEFSGAARRERHNLVGKMDGAIGLIRKTKCAEARLDHVLQIGLPRVDYVVDDCRTAEGGRVRFASARDGGPQYVPIRIGVKL